MSKWILSFMVATLMLSSVMASPQVSANTLNEMKAKKEQVEQKKNELNNGIKQKSTEIDTNKSKLTSIEEQITKINNEITTTNNHIATVENQIKETRIEVEALQASIASLEKKIAERDLVLIERVRAMQANGDPVDYLDVLLGANNFSDFIDRFSTVKTLLDADRAIMKQQAEDQEQLEAEKKIVEEKLAEQEDNKKELEGLKASFESQKQQKDQLMKELHAEQERLNKEKEALETSFQETHDISKELESQIVAEQERQMEAARKAAEAAKAAREAEAARQQVVVGGSSSSSPSSSGGILPSVSSGDWTKPSYGRTSSPFGMRTHPISGGSKMHYGDDISNAVGTPIVAAADGVIFRAGWHGSYGNHIMITHSINGQTFTTVYAHMSALNASVGQVVQKGQLIGKMGKTGSATGSHLHFELYRGAYSYGNAINPRGIVY